ncbi:hypothetical protein [Rubinisphaera brasiliensis]|uniref:Uncharacterized protein n=1 Tax=Rubinisphaera brasiliensis (strain ATCC 49424 / DSM 5305 / JCM 21570 / IAM 15109 / NBRC 103401 / IFAM 1448) TaxID=756272 RepID=F0SFX7_RUBBR|nr:hypothetical protein [Rubinisphaera brasiliensis]ADY61584.1 hypothetical protein Plabr_4007 [Rubinisphaera brasiliensis DSM 5305]
MSVKFAGARSVDDRRRRRIVSETEQGTPGEGTPSSSAGYLKLRRVEPDAEEPARAPIASLIPHRRWQIWLYCLGIPAIILLLHTACLLLPVATRTQIAEIVNWQDGHVWRFVRGVTLLGCAALCWLISWFRSASVRDFEGCFKSWYWSGWILLLVAIAAGTDAHLVAGLALKNGMQLSLVNFVTLAWLVPLASLMVEPVRCFTREMWHCRRSWIAFWACAASGMLYCWAQLQGPHTEGFVSAETLQVVASAASMLAPEFLLSALLSQVHHVMYVSSDPVPRRQSYVFRGIRIASSRVRHFATHATAGAASLITRFRSGWREGADERALRKSELRKAKAKRREEQAAAKQAAREQAAQSKSEEQETRAKAAEEKAAQKEAAKQAAQDGAARKKEEAARKKQEAAQRKIEREEAKKKAAAEKAAQREAAKREAEEKAAAAAAEKAAEREAVAAAAAAKKAAQEAARAEREKAAREEEEARQAQKTRTRKAAAARKKAAEVEEQSDLADWEQMLESESGAPAGKKAKPRIRVKSQAPAEPPAAPEPTTAPEPAAVVEQNVDTSSAAATAALSFEEAAAAVSEMAEDGGNDVIDPALLKGLSKKEKRKLRKMHRDQARKKAG